MASRAHTSASVPDRDDLGLILNELEQRIQAQEHRVAIADVLYRFGAGQDLKDRMLFESAFTPTAELDFVQPARRLGIELPVFKGRDAIVSSIMSTVSQLDTTHTVTNSRIDLDGRQAALFALVEALHLPRSDHSRHLLLKNFYWATLLSGKAGWQIEYLRIENVWMDGDPRVLFPAAASQIA